MMSQDGSGHPIASQYVQGSDQIFLHAGARGHSVQRSVGHGQGTHYLLGSGASTGLEPASPALDIWGSTGLYPVELRGSRDPAGRPISEPTDRPPGPPTGWGTDCESIPHPRLCKYHVKAQESADKTGTETLKKVLSPEFLHSRRRIRSKSG